MESERPLEARLELNADDEFPRGALTPIGGSAYRFSGWLEFSAAIEQWRRKVGREGSDAELAPRGESDNLKGGTR